MKIRATSILLFLCLIAPVATTYFILKIQKKQIKREVKWKMIAGVDKEELVLVKLTEEESHTQLRWEHSKEFEYKDQMYDIVEKEIKGDTIYYWCWWDHEETKLNKQLTTLLAGILGDNPQRKEQHNKLLDFFKKLYVDNDNNELALEGTTILHHTSYKEGCAITYFTPPVPPPRSL